MTVKQPHTVLRFTCDGPWIRASAECAARCKGSYLRVSTCLDVAIREGNWVSLQISGGPWAGPRLLLVSRAPGGRYTPLGFDSGTSSSSAEPTLSYTLDLCCLLQTPVYIHPLYRFSNVYVFISCVHFLCYLPFFSNTTSSVYFPQMLDFTFVYIQSWLNQ